MSPSRPAPGPPRRVTLGLATSLDHFIAREDGGVDWLRWGWEVAEVTAAYWPTIDTVLMGRKTWERGGRTLGGAFDGKRVIVFSRTIDPARAEGAEVVAEEAGPFTRRLEARKGAGICLYGGGELASALLAAGEVDDIVLNVHPVLLGAGVPLFRALPRSTDLELREARSLSNGCVLLTYAVARPGAR